MYKIKKPPIATLNMEIDRVCQDSHDCNTKVQKATSYILTAGKKTKKHRKTACLF